jgi:hypothetical protein
MGKNFNQYSQIVSQMTHPFSFFPDKTKMAKTQKSAKQVGPQTRPTRASSAYLDKLIAEATVDCYNESEQITGIFTMLEESLAVPFTTTLLGVEVTVERIDMNDADDIVAVCRRGRKRQRVPILDLPLPEPRPRGAEWIDAFRRWAKGG